MPLDLTADQPFDKIKYATKSFIHEGVVMCNIGETPIRFIPPSIIEDVTTMENIILWVEKGPLKGRTTQRERITFVEIIYLHAKKLFVMMAAGLGDILVLHSLVMDRNISDSTLPIRQHLMFFPQWWQKGPHLQDMLKQEALVNALTFSVAHSRVPGSVVLESLPLMGCYRSDESKVHEQGEEAYIVQFHPEYVAGAPGKKHVITRVNKTALSETDRSHYLEIRVEGEKLYLVSEAPSGA